MTKQRVYDLPTRFFHWLFVALFLLAFIIAKTVDDDSSTYSYHMLAGLTLSFVVLLRIIWGFVGTTHARFSNFALNPLELVRYFKGILSGDRRRWVGHNPASSWAALTMMGLALGLGITGYLMTSGPNKETYEDLHEILANAFLIVAILHVAGIVLHTIRHREMIGLSMIDGKKADISLTQAIPSSRPVIGFLFLGLVVLFGVNLLKKYDSQTRSLSVFGSVLQLGENEDNEENEGHENQTDGNKESDQDDD